MSSPLTDLLGQSQALRVGDWSQFLLLQLLDRLLLIPEIQLGAHQDDGCRGAVVPYLRVPLGGGNEQEHVSFFGVNLTKRGVDE